MDRKIFELLRNKMGSSYGRSLLKKWLVGATPQEWGDDVFFFRIEEILPDGSFSLQEFQTTHKDPRNQWEVVPSVRKVGPRISLVPEWRQGDPVFPHKTRMGLRLWDGNPVSIESDMGLSKIAAGPALSRDEFVEEVKRHLNVGDRVVHFQTRPFLGSVSTLFIEFVNLPENVVRSKMGGGAENENNRMSFSVGEFDEKDPTLPVEKVKVEMNVNALRRRGAVNMRAKTSNPKVIAKYLADFINNVVSSVPPNFTHTNRL